MGTDLSVLRRLRPYSIGFDSLFEHLESVLEFNDAYNAYPPYNIIQTDDTHFIVEMAVSGFSKEDINISVEDRSLVIRTKQRPEDDRKVIHRGIAKRHFKKAFGLADNVEVVSAEMADGLLNIHLEAVIPESEKPRQIEIS